MAEHGWKLLPQYRMDARSGQWAHYKSLAGNSLLLRRNASIKAVGSEPLQIKLDQLKVCTVPDDARAWIIHGY